MCRHATNIESLARTDHMVANGRTDYYHQDGNGNVTYLADQRQRLAARYTYDPYGRILARSGPVCDGNQMQFSGKECDSASGLSYCGMRFYSPTLQRWLNRDPMKFVDGPNAFKFVHNRPVDIYELYRPTIARVVP
jgi:RHS repeat-associated protein